MTDDEPLRFIEMFGGIGGFRIGIKNSSLDAECVDYIEKDKYCVQQYNEYFKDDYEPRDITELKAEDIARHDILTGGFPCQDFSIAGERKGMEGERGTLFYEIARVAEHHRPRLLFLENVKGILSSDGGRTFARILHRLDELGYDAEWQLLNSKAFGVPQNRERVFIIASLRNKRVGQVFPIRQSSQETAIEWAKQNIIRAAESGRRARATMTPNPLNKRQNGRRFKESGEPMFTLTGQDRHGLCFVGGIRKWNDDHRGEDKNNSRDFSQGHRVYDALGLSVAIAGQAGGVGAKTGLYRVPDKDLKHVNNPNHNSDRLYIPESISPALRENNDGVPKLWESALIHSRGLETKKGEQISHAVKGGAGGSSRNHLAKGWNTTEDDMSFCVDSSYHKGLAPSKVGDSQRTQVQEDSKTLRRLTPRECYRLQGFPDDYELTCSDTQGYSQAGNAVTTSVILAIAEEMEATI